MQKYSTFAKINKMDIAEFRGLERELLFTPMPPPKPLSLAVSAMGITFPDPDYYISRQPSRCFIIEYVEEGSGALEIDGTVYKVTAGDVYFIHVGDICTYYADKVNPYRKKWVNFRSICFFDVAKALGMDTVRVIHGVDLSSQFERLFALEEISDRTEEFHLEASKIIFEMLHDMRLSKLRADNERKKPSSLAYFARQKLENSLNIPTTVEELASFFYTSKSTLIKEFKAQYGQTPYQYLMTRRIDLAESLLKSTDRKIKDISDYLCFSTEYHFSSCFKKKVGCSPREYRKMHSKPLS